MVVRPLMAATLVLALAGAPVHGAAQSPPNRYQAIPDTSTPKSTWLFDTATASLSHCEANEPNKEPVCSPWSPASTSVSPTNKTDCSVRDDKGRPPIECFFK